MEIKPILFNTEMVKAILQGRKTQTRRIIKGIPLRAPYFEVYDGKPMACDPDGDWFPLEQFSLIQPGEILWVRETWCNLPVSPGGHTRLMRGRYYYKADVPDIRPDGWKRGWKPSIHMPKEAARVFLLVKSVRAERLKDIKPEDGMEEGFTGWNDFVRAWNSTVKKPDLPAYGWDANPWVWVIEFEKTEKPEGWPCTEKKEST